MNKGIPYLLAALVALTLSAGWAAPVLSLFEHALGCLQQGGGLDLLRLRCEPQPSGWTATLGTWPFWVTAAAVALAALVTMRTPRRSVSVH